ncbi:MAG TPA: M20/M25/M40 family metallo-hydrolase [Pyrinomonadaceae bacterium]|nr:M20/M25/M40 family metallo-hydrolase [Chloracidobacterium sp.]MBP9934385.1 M20/M25/M40 family metallo-hydrolase [Pyrinomonadaceae bacterium]MBK7801419.1 M20/M25/M40 family metallo-hydrolase [Chloracidobacterium sp.]MBK9766371.1 M20/M25/M40 family metallo-hydrolase [Chloracidobacterium sp.]MBL0241729.1 M20/M25/M40 family metallo-hydrolase [Chloracidobacterium sp.]
MLRRKIVGVFVIYAFLLPTLALGQSSPKVYEAPKEVLDKIKEEGTKNSQIMQTLGYMSDVIGPRLTASPGAKRANDWTRDTLAKWGLQNAHLESWGPFGRGWTLKRFTAMVDGPTAFPLIAYPKAWSPGTDTLVPAPTVDPKAKNKSQPAAANPHTSYTGEVVRFNAQNAAELEQYKGKLKGKIVLIGPIRELKAWMEAPGKRFTDTELLNMADAPDPATIRRAAGGPGGNPNFAQMMQFNSARMRFLVDEGAAILVDSARGDGGTMFVQGATAVQPPPAAPGSPANPQVRVWDKGANVPIQVSASTEHFNRVARMIDAGEKVTMTINLAVDYQDADPNGYNTLAEIPGTDKADEVVMLGGHLDSWHGGTGATDNAAGCAVMMEAVRIIQALGLKPRRTIRIGLWTGEEQGLYGSRAYVKQHLGYLGDGTTPAFGGGGGGRATTPQPLTKLAEYDKLSAYFNIDNGTGKIRGVYMQGNEGVRPFFRNWLSPFKDPKWYDASKPLDMSASTLTLENTGGTDHLSFDGIGLPGFQFIQDAVEYDTRTHHSNQDVLDRIQPDDVKQMAIIVATFVYQAAMMDDKMPRKR